MPRSLASAASPWALLHADGTVDVERTRELVALASPLEVTFHRAFDVTPSLPDALEAVIRTGSRRVLTSGGAETVFAGAANLAELVKLARGRIQIAVGGGLRGGRRSLARQRYRRPPLSWVRPSQQGPAPTAD